MSNGGPVLKYSVIDFRSSQDFKERESVNQREREKEMGREDQFGVKIKMKNNTNNEILRRQKVVRNRSQLNRDFTIIEN